MPNQSELLTNHNMGTAIAQNLTIKINIEILLVLQKD